ncbi:MAG: NUDIX hydrolase [Pseudomonadota bacterium]|nr:NUDIX hydrolase [Pseudomonadota bacterium]
MTILRPTVRVRHRVARLGYRLVYTGFRVASVGLRPKVRGALAALWVDGHVLLVRNSYNRWHTLPGGRTDRGESFRDGAVRELREETGIAVAADRFRPVHAERFSWLSRHETIEIHAADLDRQPEIRLDPVEIAEARWVTPAEALRLDLYPPLARYLASLPD